MALVFAVWYLLSLYFKDLNYVPFLALDLAAFFARACLCFAKQDKWSTHIWTSSLLRRVDLAKVSIVFSSISWSCLALLLNTDLITSLGGEN